MLVDFQVDSNNKVSLILNSVPEGYKYLKVKFPDEVKVVDGVKWEQVDDYVTLSFVNEMDIVPSFYLSTSKASVLGKDDVCLADRLFSFSDKEYRRHFRWRGHRPKVGQLPFFSARQMAKHYSGLICFRVGAAVIEAYKAIESKNNDFIKDALVRVDSAFLLLDSDFLQTENHFYPRESNVHQRYSLLCAKWHLLIMLKDYEGMLGVLRTIKQGIMNTGILYTICYLVNLSLLLLLLVAKYNKDDALFNEVLKQMHYIFSRAISDYNTFQVNHRDTFAELAVPHNAIVLAYDLRDKFDNEEGRDELVKKIFKSCVRVKGGPAESMYINFISFFNDGELVK